jgi:hypothetical protein
MEQSSASHARMAEISGSRVNDESVKCLRIFADAHGETHMEDVDITLRPRKLFKDNPPLRLSDNLRGFVVPLLPRTRR